MKIEVLTVGPFQVNCYVVKPKQDSNSVFVIDPGDEGKRIAEFIESEGYDPVAVLLTHAHLDHIKGCADLVNHFGINVYVPDADVAMFLSDANELAPYLYRDCEFPEPVALSAYPMDGNSCFEAIATPGHTQGGVCYYFSELSSLFSGDTLFAGGVGRTDLPGGNHNQLISSIKQKLFVLPNETKVFPGHGGSSSIESEKRSNPYVC